MLIEREREVAQSCPTLSDPMDCRPPGSSIHGIFQAKYDTNELIYKTETRLTDIENKPPKGGGVN